MQETVRLEIFESNNLLNFRYLKIVNHKADDTKKLFWTFIIFFFASGLIPLCKKVHDLQKNNFTHEQNITQSDYYLDEDNNNIKSNNARSIYLISSRKFKI